MGLDSISTGEGVTELSAIDKIKAGQRLGVDRLNPDNITPGGELDKVRGGKVTPCFAIVTR